MHMALPMCDGLRGFVRGGDISDSRNSMLHRATLEPINPVTR